MTTRPPERHPDPARGLRGAVAEALRGDLAAGRFRPGDRLPSESDLATRFGVHRHTVREALARLAREGLVATRRGAGSFVLAPPADYPIGPRVRFSENIRASGRFPSRAGLTLVTRAADAPEAEALHLFPGDPVHVWEGTGLADGEPVALFRSAFPAARFPDLPAHLGREPSVTAALAASGVPDYRRATTRLAAVLATPDQAARLRLALPAALLRSTHVNADPKGNPVEFGSTWFGGDRVALVLAEEGAA
ncbi:phosphonate metabolism transcriptional regulator PhnF [Rubellimicrobium roseum]|uniref:Phosphonate metabolism transcriptional regulator PhnF n=1 Tax=Rubellimicrobium roseum TaxID=687525 RepID=A0A5C4NDW0_9RHOB|nr:phosphonate metabolism transcriptional regulator PhnF [Rubellimicrobium roseum]TNC71326.1 phosphonate metabolism transcriptional regulator PhnF [Rubellimicrobium roseum]